MVCAARHGILQHHPHVGEAQRPKEPALLQLLARAIARRLIHLASLVDIRRLVGLQFDVPQDHAQLGDGVADHLDQPDLAGRPLADAHAQVHQVLLGIGQVLHRHLARGISHAHQRRVDVLDALINELGVVDVARLDAHQPAHLFGAQARHKALLDIFVGVLHRHVAHGVPLALRDVVHHDHLAVVGRVDALPARTHVDIPAVAIELDQVLHVQLDLPLVETPLVQDGRVRVEIDLAAKLAIVEDLVALEADARHTQPAALAHAQEELPRLVHLAQVGRHLGLGEALDRVRPLHVARHVLDQHRVHRVEHQHVGQGRDLLVAQRPVAHRLHHVDQRLRIEREHHHHRPVVLRDGLHHDPPEPPQPIERAPITQQRLRVERRARPRADLIAGHRLQRRVERLERAARCRRSQDHRAHQPVGIVRHGPGDLVELFLGVHRRLGRRQPAGQQQRSDRRRAPKAPTPHPPSMIS